MRFTPTPLDGAFVIDVERHGDERGFFARAFSTDEFRAHGLNPAVVQANLSNTATRGTIRGMHLQQPPHAEAKLVRCVRGALYDVAVDLRPESPTYRQWFGVELRDDTHRALYVPEGFAHGFQTLADDTTAFYLVSAAYAPGAEAGVRYDDPAIGITWPLNVTVVSDKDAAWPLLDAPAGTS